MRYDKIVTDPIHGQMHIDSESWAVIDTPQFQRLRDLKQLGSAYFVFPGASHNRFEHSLGVSHLSNQLINHLRVLQLDLEIDDFDVKNVTLAGLTHDLGHGPFSHIFDAHVIPRLKPGTQWTHEIASERMLEYLVNDNGLSEDDCSEEDVKFIKALIRGSGDAKPHKRFLFDIVNNKRNSVDVDKFDYIARDSHHCGVKVGFDHQRSMRFTRVIDQEICWNKNEALNLCQLFSTRFNLFKQVYTHKVGKSIELMLIDALCLADEHLRIGDAIESEEQYTHLTDAILKEIERSRAPELKPSQDVLKRIRLRDLYRCAGTFVLPQQLVGRITKENFTAQRILQYADASELKGINADDIFPEFLVLSWCFGTENPIKMCRFHNKYKLNDKFEMPMMQLSHSIPTNPQEITLRVFVRFDTMRVTVWNIFERFIKNLELEYPASTVSVPLDLAGSDVEEDGEEFVFGVKQTFGVIGSDKEKHVGEDSFRQMEKNLGLSTSNEFDDDFEGTNADQYSTPVRNVGGTDKSIKRQRPGSSAGSFDGAKFRRVASDLSSDGENRMYFTLDGEVGLNGSMLPPPPLHASLGLSKGNELPGDYMERRNESPHKKRSIEKDKKRK